MHTSKQITSDRAWHLLMINYTKEANLLGHRTVSATLQLDKLQLEDVILYIVYLKLMKTI